MFCPQCGQRQISNDARFCSSCGFAMNVVAELLAHGGQLPWRPPAPGSGHLSPRQKGIRQGAMLMLSTLLIVPLLAILGVAMLGFPGEIVALAAVGCFMGGFLRILYAFFLESKVPADAAAAQQVYMPPSAVPNYLGTPQQISALPPPQSAPVPIYHRPQRFDTGEIAPPSSITENTTRLLEKQPDESSKQ